ADTEYTPMIGALWQPDEQIVERDGYLDVEAADTEFTPMVGALWQSDEPIIERDGCLDVEAADTEYTPMIGALWQPDEQIVERDECMSTGGFPYYDKELYLEMDSKIPSSSQGARPQFLSKDIKSCAPSCFDLVASSGYVWKSDRYFKEVYGNGIEDIITLDSTWWISRHYGMGLKGSYWSANGRVIGIPEPTNVWQIPLVFSLKGRIGSTFQVYGSIGVDFIIVCESNFLGEANQRAWGGEVEGGINYFFYKQIYLNAACRYIYSRKFITAVQDTADFGGLDVRAGIGFSF
ncbi:MAG: hypothetical protein NTY13_06330, partial [Chlamydiae bacterium]|nr:hypothetical protein [Chlamydiota bacterium]